jgi:putative cell wall-binding protein
MAAPMVSGSASLLWRAVPALSNVEIAQVIEGSAQRMAPVVYDTYTGYGAFWLPAAYTRLVTAYPLLRVTPVFVPSVSPSPDVSVTWLAPSARGLSYDVALDGVTVATGLDTTRFVLHGVPNGAHTVTLTPRSTYNWDDGSQAATVSFSVAAGSAPVHAQVVRLAGADRYAANANAVEAGWSGARTVVLVGGEVWPDALSAAPLARQLEGPVLVTRTRTLSANAAAEIQRLGASQVVIVGGPNSVSESVRAQVQGMGVGVRRIWGTDRYTTAEAVARELASLQGGQLAEKTAIVASGETFTDALPASAVAATKRWPILLSRRTGAPTSTRATFVALGGNRTVVVGRYSALSTTVNKQFPGVERISAGTQLNVPVALANWAVTRYPASFDGRSLALVSSTAWADGLSAGSLSSLDGSLVILTPKNLATEPAAYLRAVKPRVDRLRVIGGPVSVSGSALNTARSLLR